MNKIASLLAALALSFGVQFNALAVDATAPDALVKSVTDDVITIVRQDKAIQSGDTRKAVELVETRVLPYFDFAHMTRLAVGKDWKQATPEQKAVLTQELKTLLVRTYSNALTQYRNQQIDFKPLKAKPEDTDVLVRTEVRQPGAKAVQIDYNLEKLADGWKVYDVLVAGVSLVTNYRDDFGKEVRAGGIDGLIKYLKDKNKQLDTPATAKK
ncbi:MAG: ABC transporter substrate-binding protein [Zoogloea sp.]|nr:ABC transporter substrate-binding protein [Zoogloea sp.]MCA0184728.1 ABC transporter substrate-binding protein [Pseudomonadota bacterium]